MLRKDLIEKSPVRRLEASLSGGLKAGELGVITSEKGAGKTSMLVQLGLDELLKGNKVFHISFSQGADYAITWYNNMYDELAQAKNLENAAATKSEIFANRIILNFNQDTIRIAQIIKTVQALTEGANAKPHALMIDDFDFTKTGKEALIELKHLAKELDLAVWFTARTDVQDGIPHSLQPFSEEIDVVLLLTLAGNKEVSIKALKEHGNKNVAVDVKFDAKSLLLM